VDRKIVEQFFSKLQESIVVGLEGADGQARFRRDRWSASETPQFDGGGGLTCVIEDGAVFEKGGVNLSAVEGRLSSRIAAHLKVSPGPFFATGVSLVLHPRSPQIPTVHMNVRYLEIAAEEGWQDGVARRWFGGGADLTPYYLYAEDARHFHETLATACDDYRDDAYARFKSECDGYFRSPHRDEARGIGGIFFDYLEQDLEKVFEFVQGVGRAFLPSYLPIVERRRDEAWSEHHREWQLLRRGRYVEFNLVHDRGTLFGLETGGRTEAILMSLPPTANWRYNYQPEAGSPEAQLVDVLKHPRDWIER